MSSTVVEAPGQAAGAARRRTDWVDGLLLVWLGWALAGLVWTPHDPHAQVFLSERLAGPGWGHWLGVDGLGRDVLSRVWLGSGHTVLLGAGASAGTLALASLLLVAERRGPRALAGIVRSVVSAGLALPVLLVGLVLLVFLEPSPWTLVVACAVGGVPFGFRQLRVMWVEQAGALHVTASRALGGDAWHVARFAIWPNIRAEVAVLAKLLFAVGVLELSGLTFLGLTGDPDYAELGTILRQNQAYLFQQPWLVVWPGVLLSGMLLVVHLSNVRGESGARGLRR